MSVSIDSERGDGTKFPSLVPLDLTVVVPTFNERDNVPQLLERLHKALKHISWEVVFVDDDSPDGTAELVREIARYDRSVRIIKRIDRRGLSSATVEGVLSSAAPYFAIMDADLQHDEEVLPRMFDRIKAGMLDVVVGSRYVGTKTAPEGLNPRRRTISDCAAAISRLLLSAELSDPMSGFFMMRRSAFDEVVPLLSKQGFKILLDIFVSAQRPLRFEEVPCRFHRRVHGESKLDSMAVWEFGMLMLDKLVGRFVPVRFAVFAFVGGTGLFVHLTTLFVSTSFGLRFDMAQTVAVITAMSSNFFINNLVTYRDRRLRGWELVPGLISFYAICAIGAAANVGVADLIFNTGGKWWLAGLSGAAISAVWNFAVSNYLTWQRQMAKCRHRALIATLSTLVDSTFRAR
jgi:dolichol-phosphate mannosyltransferase